MAKWNLERLPDTYKLNEGQAFIRIEGQTYRVDISEFKLHAKTGVTQVNLTGVLVE